MPDNNKPDFGFLNEEQKSSSDSAILEKKETHSSDKPVSQTPENAADSEHAWMDDAETSDHRYDSSARFAGALSDDTSTQSDDNLFDQSAEKITPEETSPQPSFEPQELEKKTPVEEEQKTEETSLESDTAPCNISNETEQNKNTKQPTTEKAEEEPATEEDPAIEDVEAVTPASLNKKQIPVAVVSKKLFILALSYASAVTLVCAFLIMQSMNGKPHELESLPDIKPPMKDDQVAYRLVPEAVNLPAGHTLAIGQSRRFGNLLVTATKVVFEPVQFTHYSDDPTKKRAASSPVMKLWLKFENVSKNQNFAPLDRQLMLTRILDPKDKTHMRSNQFLCPSSGKGNHKKTSLLYDLEMMGDWNFSDVQDEPTLAPGETLLVYLPSNEQAYKKMNGEITWRVQFRKGYHPKSKRGVTTLIEVVFNKKDVIAS